MTWATTVLFSKRSPFNTLLAPAFVWKMIHSVSSHSLRVWQAHVGRYAFGLQLMVTITPLAVRIGVMIKFIRHQRDAIRIVESFCTPFCFGIRRSATPPDGRPA